MLPQQPRSCALTVHVGDPHELKNGNDDEGIGGSVGVHKLKHVNSALAGKRNKIDGPGLGSLPHLPAEGVCADTSQRPSPP